MKYTNFTDKFDRKYGVNSYIMLIAMFKDPLISLQDIAIYFDFSRETASRYFKKVFGFPFSQCTNSRYSNKIRFFRGRVYLIYSQALEVLRNKGFCPLLVPYKSSYRIIINGHILAARRLYLSLFSSPSSSFISKPKFYTAVKGKSQVDFFLLFAPDCSYLVPMDCMPAGISVPVTEKSKYQQFRDSFDVLYGVPAGCRRPLK